MTEIKLEVTRDATGVYFRAGWCVNSTCIRKGSWMRNVDNAVTDLIRILQAGDVRNLVDKNIATSDG